MSANTTLYSYVDSLARTSEVLPAGTDLAEISKGLPLLNVYVPTFLQKGWDTDTQIPWIAVRNAQNKLIVFDRDGREYELNPLEEPQVPIIVINENERLVAAGPHIRPDIEKHGDFVFADGTTKYYFLDNEYNQKLTAPVNKHTANRQVPTSAIDYKVKEAYDINKACDYCWQRDWIYYGINPSAGILEGRLNENYQEAITAMRFENVSGLETIGGWDEGNFEFWITDVTQIFAE